MDVRGARDIDLWGSLSTPVDLKRPLGWFVWVVCLHGLDVRDGRAVPPGLGSGLFPVWQEFSIHLGLPPNPMVLEILTGHKLSI